MPKGQFWRRYDDGTTDNTTFGAGECFVQIENVRPMLSLGLLGHVLQLRHILAAHEACHTLSVK